MSKASALVIHSLADLVLFTLLFAAIFKILPDAKVAWRDVWTGAAVTAVLFIVGKFALGFYLGQQSTQSAYGAVGSIGIVLIFIYYAAMILLLGAEFTQVWSCRFGKPIRPKRGAVHTGRKSEAAPAEPC